MYNKKLVLEQFFKKPTTRFHIRELARLTKIHPNTIIKITDELEKEGYLVKKRYKNLVEAQANVESEMFIREKKLFNISQLYGTGLVDNLVSFYHQPKAIILYGSYSRGEDFEKSDIDIAVFTQKKDAPEISNYEKKIGKNIHILPIGYDTISEEFYTNIINGFILHGYLEIKK